MADSSSSSSSVNNSFPVVVPTPENGILDQIAQYASSLAPQMLDWANNEFAQTSAVTNESINNFFNSSQQMTGLAGNMINDYNNLARPEYQQLVQDANSYASPSRMQTDMGMAGATQAQAGDAAIKNSEQNLLSYGIDPSSGRYASLDKAAAVQNSANVAGAENQQRMADINTGQQLRAEAVQAGSLMPAAISNAENTAIQANAGASNASLANANTGANMMDLANKYLQTAMSLKLSPVGQRSSGSSTSNSQTSGGNSGSGSGNSGGGGGGGIGSGGGGGGTGGYNGEYQDTAAMGNDGGTSYGGGAQPNAGIYGVPDNSYQTDAGFGGYGGGDSSGGGSDLGGGDFSGGGYGDGGGGDFTTGGAVMMTQGGKAQPALYDSSDDGSATTGGAVDPSMSPSGGAQTDDVNAHLNANEFVVPKDVALWKGQEFFHNLIAQSRTKRAQAAATVAPQRQPMRPGAARFSSQAMR